MPDREKVVEGLEKVWDAFNHMEHEMYADYVFDALALLKEQEAVVRCKDCKHYRYYGLTYDTVSECTIFHCENPDKDWFCAGGER